MSSQVWLRFEKKKDDGTVMKFKIQDLPEERILEATELMVKYFARDEPFRKALGFSNNPEALEEYRKYAEESFRASRTVMSCADTDDENPAIMGISSIALVSESSWNLNAGKGTDETQTINAIFYDGLQQFNVVKELKLSSYYTGKSILIVPEYRGNGMADKFLRVRRMMCAAHGVPLTDAWMSHFATQKAAARDGWETLYEIPYEDISRKYGVRFEGVPPTVKLMVGRPHPDYPAAKSALTADVSIRQANAFLGGSNY